MLDEFLHADETLRTMWRSARRKVKRRSLARLLERRALWLDYMMPVLVLNWAIPEQNDRVRKQQRYRDCCVIITNWNMYLSHTPNYLNITFPEAIPQRARDCMGPNANTTTWDPFRVRDIVGGVLQLYDKLPLKICKGPAMGNQGYGYQTQLWYSYDFPVHEVFAFYSAGFGAQGGTGMSQDAGVYRTYVFNSNMHNPATGRRSVPKTAEQLQYHLKWKPPVHSLCIGPVMRRTAYGKMAYVAKELVIHIDLRSSRRVCCGQFAKLCVCCRELLSFFATIMCTILHELFSLDRLIPFYDGETGVYIMCTDRKLWDVGVPQRREMMKLVREVYYTFAARRLLPCTLCGLVWRLNELSRAFLACFLKPLVCVGVSPFVDSTRLSDVLDLAQLSEGVETMIRHLCSTKELDCEDLAELLVEAQQAYDSSGVDRTVSRVTAYLRRVFHFSFRCLDEGTPDDYIYPCMFSCNPFTNNIIIPLPLCHLPCYTMDLMAVPVLVCRIQYVLGTWSCVGDARFFPSFLSKAATNFTLRRLLGDLHRYAAPSGYSRALPLVIDCNIYHLSVSYTKWDRMCMTLSVRDLLEMTLRDLESTAYENTVYDPTAPTYPAPTTWFGSIFKQYSSVYQPFDTEVDQPLAQENIRLTRAQLSDIKPLRLSHRVLRALMLTARRRVTVLHTWQDINHSGRCVHTVASPVPTHRINDVGVRHAHLPLSIIRPDCPRHLFNRPTSQRATRFTERELRIIQALNFAGWHTDEAYLHKRMRLNADQPRAGQLPPGLSSGEDYSETSSDQSSVDTEYDLHGDGRGNSVDHYVLSGRPGDLDLVITTRNTQTEMGNEVTAVLRQGITNEKWQEGLGLVKVFRPQHAYMGAVMMRPRVLRSVRRYRPYSRSSCNHRRAASAAHIQHCRAQSVCVPDVLLPPQALYRAMARAGVPPASAVAVRMESSRRRVMGTRSARTAASSYLSQRAYKGNFGQYRAYPHSLGSRNWERDSLVRTEAGSQIVAMVGNNNETFSPRFQSRSPSNVVLAALRPVNTYSTTSYFQEVNRRRVMDGSAQSCDSGSLWGRAELAQDAEWPISNSDDDSSARRDRVARFNHGCHSVDVDEGGFDSRRAYARALIDTGVDGNELNPSSEDSGSEGTSSRMTYSQWQRASVLRAPGNLPMSMFACPEADIHTRVTPSPIGGPRMDSDCISLSYDGSPRHAYSTLSDVTSEEDPPSPSDDDDDDGDEWAERNPAETRAARVNVATGQWEVNDGYVENMTFWSPGLLDGTVPIRNAAVWSTTYNAYWDGPVSE
uniref:EO2-4 n=1 Tax=Grenadier adomavirus TaxID=2609868 RepID=A0A6F9FCS8_9VIRU|nr:TPA_asm: EO2-4 [Grenadier adomavirus]